MCEMCDLAVRRGPGAPPPRFDLGRPTSTRFAAPTHLEAQYSPGAAAPEGVGRKGRRTLIKGGVVVSMDPDVGNFAPGDVLIEGSKIVAVGASLDAAGAAGMDARGHIVIPGFIDTHHHQFETALRSALADAILINDGRPESANNYYESVLSK